MHLNWLRSKLWTCLAYDFHYLQSATNKSGGVAVYIKQNIQVIKIVFLYPFIYRSPSLNVTVYSLSFKDEIKYNDENIKLDWFYLKILTWMFLDSQKSHKLLRQTCS